MRKRTTDGDLLFFLSGPLAAGILMILLLAGLSCKNKYIGLGIVRHVPGYFHNKMHFGEDMKLMEEKNAFILETGEIDTTSETPPLEVAFISIKNRTIQLDLTRRYKASSRVTEEYAGQGYILTLIYYPENDTRIMAKGKIMVNHGTKVFSYHVVAQPGYH